MKTVLITGASRGIGAACARVFAREGYNVVINCKENEEKARALSQELEGAFGVSTLVIKADVSKNGDVRKMFRAALERFGFIDVLINNAGISLIKLFTETTDEEWEKMTATNLDAVFFCCQAALPLMIREHRGAIVNIASMWGEVGASCEVAYSAAKAGVIGLTKALSKEVAPAGVRVNCVSPGVVMTDMMSEVDDDTLKSLKDETPLGTLGTPNDVAEAAFFLSSEKAAFITGQVLGVNGGMVI